MSDSVDSTLSQSEERHDPKAPAADELILLLECDQPRRGSSRHVLVEVNEVLIGRGEERHAERRNGRLSIRVADPRISRVHATLKRDGDAFIVVDAGSKNGLVVNGRGVARHLLRDGDIIECGRTFFLFRMGQRRPVGDALDATAEVTPTPNMLRTFHGPLAAQFRTLASVARSPLPVLILGATGTGKEGTARALHHLSGRNGGFVGINCGAMPESLVEAELFGSRRGAFTGAKDNRPGLIRSSNGGTLFLDEVGDLALQSQAALLRVLQEREVMAVGATRAEAVDLRVMAATHRDLEALACEARFRNDLLARLSGFIIRLPALRERMEDFGLLTAGLLAQHGTAETTISPEAMRLLLRYDWPLNIRELEHGLRAALALSPARIEPVGLPGSLREGDLNPRRFVSPEQAETIQTWTPEQLARRQQLCTLLSAHRGNISAVARELDKERIQIRRWIKQLAISSDEIESR